MVRLGCRTFNGMKLGHLNVHLLLVPRSSYSRGGRWRPYVDGGLPGQHGAFTIHVLREAGEGVEQHHSLVPAQRPDRPHNAEEQHVLSHALFLKRRIFFLHG